MYAISHMVLLVVLNHALSTRVCCFMLYAQSRIEHEGVLFDETLYLVRMLMYL